MELTTLRGEDLRRVRTGVQMIFQDPIASLNPRRRVADIVREGLDIWPEASEQATERVRTALSDVGMDFEEAGNRRPHEFSGGQCQRICIARALALLDPRVLICDEPVSALDVSIQAQILNLLEDLKELYGLTMLFIAHDLAVVKSISDRVCVMYLGRICEIGPTDAIFDQPGRPPLHGGSAGVDTAAGRRRGRRGGRAARRSPVTLRGALGLPLPHPLRRGPPTSAPSRCRSCARRRRDSSWPATSR